MLPRRTRCGGSFRLRWRARTLRSCALSAWHGGPSAGLDAFTAFDVLCRPADSRAEGPKGCEAAQSRGGKAQKFRYRPSTVPGGSVECLVVPLNAVQLTVCSQFTPGHAGFRTPICARYTRNASPSSHQTFSSPAASVASALEWSLTHNCGAHLSISSKLISFQQSY